METSEKLQQGALNAEAVSDEMMHEAIDSLAEAVEIRIESNKRQLAAMPDFEPRPAKQRARNKLLDTGTIANGG